MKSRLWLLALAYAASFFVTAAILRLFVPDPPLPDISEKLSYYKAHRSRYNVLFVGSSRFYHQISPKVFDGAMEEHGYKCHSFNFGIDSLFPPESGCLLDRILEIAPDNLDWIFVEMMDFFPRAGSEVTTERAVYWHNFRRTSLVLQHIWNESIPLGEKVNATWQHLHGFFQYSTGRGRGAHLFSHWLDSTPKKAKVENEGFMPISGTLTAAQLEHFTKSCAGMYVNGRRVETLNPIAAKEFARVGEEIVQHGKHAVWVISPSTQPRPHFSGADKFGPVLTFDDEASAPEFFQQKQLYDENHLNTQGAATFTRNLAENFWTTIGNPALK